MDEALFPALDARAAFDLYEHWRHRLPQAQFPAKGKRVSGIVDLAAMYDVFVFDAFGVLNVGETPIAGAREALAELRHRGKACFVLTNAASYGLAAAVRKFERLGFDFSAEEIVSSRMAAERHLPAAGVSGYWAVAALDGFDTGELNAPCKPLGDDPQVARDAGGFLFLSSNDWTAERQRHVERAMRERSRPVVIANPDIVAPRETAFSTEPGYCGHRLADICEPQVTFHGKPFRSVYDLVIERCGPDVPAQRICAVGDTLHTDILGAAAMGWGTVLVTDHGLMRSLDIAQCIARSGIVPQWIMPSI